MSQVETTADSPAALARLRTRDRTLQKHLVLARRRILVAALNVVTVALLATMMGLVLGAGGVSALKVVMWLAFVTTLPWLSIGFWNAVIGTIVEARGHRDDPMALEASPDDRIVTRTAVVMAVRNEDAATAIGRVRVMFDDIIAHGLSDHIDVHVLSDSDDPAIAVAEEREIALWRAQSSRPTQIFYRRRVDNRGYKAGNLEEFCGRCGEDYDYFLPLDADSVMSATLVARLVRIMQRHRRLGILQSLAVGMPSRSFFTRTFQFGMRHGMRAYTQGSVWWQGDCGPYWGHNALIRIKPFRDHCTLPVLPGRGPLGGHIMSHDQVEAVLMRRAGYHVRVLVEEGGSWEENPPTLPDFVRRELRWCQGNMQYFQLLAMPGLKPLSRVQLALAILMYLGAPAWMAFLGLGAASLFTEGAPVPVGVGIALLAVMMTMTFAPKLLGLARVFASGRESARYGGRLAVALGGAVELVASMLMAPVVAFAVGVFAVGLLFGKRIDWRAPPRGTRTVAWDEAAATFAPQTAFGLALFGLIVHLAPGVLPWAAPVLAGLVLAIPFAVLSTSPRLGRWSMRCGLCAIPEEASRPEALAPLVAGHRRGLTPAGRASRPSAAGGRTCRRTRSGGRPSAPCPSCCAAMPRPRTPAWAA